MGTQTTTQAREEYGTVRLTSTHSFRWLRARDGEVHGGLFDQHDRPVPGTFGWWRTEDARAAAEVCGEMNNVGIEKACGWHPGGSVLLSKWGEVLQGPVNDKDTSHGICEECLPRVHKEWGLEA